MITHLKLRIAASALTMWAVLHPALAHCQIAAPAALHVDAAVTQLDHISVATVGKGAPVILIPGLSSPRETWAALVPTLAKTHRVYLVQVNGFGGDAPRGNLKPGVLDGAVAELDSYIAKQHLSGAAVIGHSMGGLVALMLAKAHPDDVGRVMIVDSLPFAGTMFLPTATVAMVEPQAAAMRDRMAAGYGKPADPAMTQATATRLALKPGSRTAVAGWFAQADPRVSGEALYEDLTTDLRPAMAGIATPVTLVYPWSDALPEAQAAATYHAAYADAPHVSYVPIADAAHFVMLDQPAAFAAAVATFLK